MHPGKTSARGYPYHGERVVVGGGGGEWRGEGDRGGSGSGRGEGGRGAGEDGGGQTRRQYTESVVQ